MTGIFTPAYSVSKRTGSDGALHYLVHVMVQVEEAAVPLDESGTVAFVRLIKPPGVTDHLNP